MENTFLGCAHLPRIYGSLAAIARQEFWDFLGYQPPNHTWHHKKIVVQFNIIHHI